MFSPANKPEKAEFQFADIEQMAETCHTQPVLVDEIFGESGGSFFLSLPPCMPSSLLLSLSRLAPRANCTAVSCIDASCPILCASRISLGTFFQLCTHVSCYPFSTPSFHRNCDEPAANLPTTHANTQSLAHIAETPNRGQCRRDAFDAATRRPHRPARDHRAPEHARYLCSHLVHPLGSDDGHALAPLPTTFQQAKPFLALREVTL